MLDRPGQKQCAFDLVAWASTYTQLGSAYRAVGDLPRARQMFEDGLAYTKANMSGRTEGQAEGFLLNDLAGIAFAQRDSRTALISVRHPGSPVLRGRGSRRSPIEAEGFRANMRRWAANSYLNIGRAQFALGNSDKADARLALFDFIEGWYNSRRRHSALDYLSPMMYERTSGLGDRTVPSGATIDQGGAMSISPSAAGL